MSRWRFVPVLLGASLLHSAQQPPQPALPPDEDKQKPAPNSDLPPDEDAANSGKETFVFNPVKSKKDVEVGDWYFKKGDYKAAALRYRDATNWNQGNAAAWLALGKAEEKRGQTKAAHDAYQKYLQLAGNARGAAEIQKKLEKLK